MLSVFTSCKSESTVFEEYIKFENLSWNRFDIIKFEVSVEDIKPEYDVYIHLRHIPEFPNEELKINLSILSSSGGMRSSDYTLDLIDNDGNRLSECLGDLCDFRKCIRREVKFTDSGIVTFEIENKYSRVELPGVIEVGLIVNEAENN